MRLLQITDRLSCRGGADVHLLGLLDALGEDHDLLLLCGRDDQTATAPCPVEFLPGLDASNGATVTDRVTDRLDALRRRFAPDLIHVHNIVNPQALHWAADHGAIITVQDHRSFCPGRGKLTLDAQICTDPFTDTTCAPCFTDSDYFTRIIAVTRERLDAIRRMAAVIVLSRYMRDELTSVGVATDRVHVIPPFVHSIDTETPTAESVCILFVGRLVTAKGVDDAIAAWRRSGVSLPLVFAGTGPERGRLEALGFEVLGWTPHTEMAATYRRAAAVILTSRWQEPFGIAGLEAMTLGLPVVAWESGGIRDWHPGPLVPWGDIDGLAAGLRDACAQKLAPSPSPSFARPQLMDRLTKLYAAVTP